MQPFASEDACQQTREGFGAMVSYQPGVYAGNTRDVRFPYRVKYAKQPGRPLLVFFHGGGAAGRDNLRPLWEFLFGPYPEWFPLQKRRALLGSDLTVLIPQCGRGAAYDGEAFVSAVKELCETLAGSASADRGRIWCMGDSWGGRCAWLSAFLFPDFYACAMPMMGALDLQPVPEKLTPQALAHMRDLPVWASHSADDPVVPVGRDDETVALLRLLGAPVKYTRVNGRGHDRLISQFLKTEPWAEWMFAQKKSLPPARQ